MRRVEVVIFDWAGTTVDHGSLAPVKAVTELFARHGVPLSDDDVRRDMGLFKKDHIRRILAVPHVDLAWRTQTARPPGESDVESLFGEFASVQMKILEAHSELIAGVAEVAVGLQRDGVRLGSTTGYTREMLDFLVARAAAQGYAPEISLCPEDLGGGRPHPWMCWRIALKFRLSSVASAVKVGDTVSDIQEGLNAGMWTVGVSRTGNEVGLSEAALAGLSGSEIAHRIELAAEKLRNAGAHYVVESAALLEPVLERINQRLAAGEHP